MEQLFLVLHGTPTAIDVELDPVVRGISCRSAQRAEQSGVEFGHGRNFVIEDRHTVRDGAVFLPKWYRRMPPETSIVVVVPAAIPRGWPVGVNADGGHGVRVRNVGG
jgi:hypothetical protein